MFDPCPLNDHRACRHGGKGRWPTVREYPPEGPGRADEQDLRLLCFYGRLVVPVEQVDQCPRRRICEDPGKNGAGHKAQGARGL